MPYLCYNKYNFLNRLKQDEDEKDYSPSQTHTIYYSFMHSSQVSSDEGGCLDMSDYGSSGTREFDQSMKHKIAVSRNNLMLNTCISLFILLFLNLPYFLPWYHEESTVKSFDGKPRHLYFFLSKVWVPLHTPSIIWNSDLVEQDTF